MRCPSFAGVFNLPCIRKDTENDVVLFTYAELSEFTGQFSPDNLIGVSQYGKLFRGKMPMQDETTKDVAVKILIASGYFTNNNDLLRLEDELKFLQDPRIRGNPNLVKLIGYCRDDKILAVVYDLYACDTLFKLIIRDDFKWLMRVKVALALARFLNFLHSRKSWYIIRNINPEHIVLDQDFNPFLFDFGMIVGRVLEKTVNNREVGTFGYVDPVVARAGVWSVKSDVYAFGVLLLNLMSKRVTDKKNVKDTHVASWAMREYQHGRTLVHPSFQDDPNFDSRDGLKMTDLARQCIDDKQGNRPVMKEVVKCLEALHVVQQYGEAWEEEVSSFQRR